MGMSKVTLSADKELVARAKKMAKREGTSLSSMFSRFLAAVLGGSRKGARPGPVTLKATGLVKLPMRKSDRELLDEALVERHGTRQ